jgi:DNA-binding response OmpR family regulator
MGQAVSEWRRVLIVDDDRDTRDMYAESLRADGFEVMAAPSGEDALRLALTFLPTVVVTDLRLKGKLDGLELVRRLRGDGRTAGARIIMLTGASLGNEHQHAKAAGCDRFVVKPCLPEALAGEIRGVATRDARPDRGGSAVQTQRRPDHSRKA